MRPIGLHIRIHDTLLHAAHYAKQLDIPIFQCFLVHQSDRQPLSINTRTARAFQEKTHSRTFYVHGSYWINLAQLGPSGIAILKKEINLTKELGAKHLILRPGSAIATSNHQEGIDKLARILNKIMAHEHDITLVLENTAHAHNAIGSNLEDFQVLKEKLDAPERLRFCIDTAHAHAYGYDITNPIAQNDFITLIDRTVGLDTVAILHLNDAIYPCGSHIDKHALLGHGTIGISALQSFALHPRLATIPLILELPSLPIEQDNAMLNLVRSWHAQ